MDIERTVVYEVNIEVDNAAAGEYRRWLDEHIDEILALPGFIDARIHDVLDPPAAAGRVALCVHYLLHDEAALDDYLREHAPRLRAEGQAKFGGRFHATRRILRLTPD